MTIKLLHHYPKNVKSLLGFNNTCISYLLMSVVLLISACGGKEVELSVSSFADRSNSTALAGLSLEGDVYIFITPEEDITGVRFYLNTTDASGGSPSQIENNPPYDFKGGTVTTPNPFDTTTLSDGEHFIFASITLSDNSIITTQAGFTVNNLSQGNDSDGDGVLDANDLCPNTAPGTVVAADGCDDTQRDTDGDGVNDALDQCPATLPGEAVDANGCTQTQAAPTISQFSATPLTIAAGSGAELSWTTLDADTVTIEPGIGIVTATGTLTVMPATTTTYTISASNAIGVITQNVTITVEVATALNIIKFEADKNTMTSDQQVVLSWDVENATSVNIQPFVGTVRSSGSTTLAIDVDTTFTITAEDSTSSVSQALTINVVPLSLKLDLLGTKFVGEFVNLTGTFQAPDLTNLSIALNGTQATITGNQFEFSNVPLVLGDNLFEITMVSGSYSLTRDVFLERIEKIMPFSISVLPNAGLVPFNATISMEFTSQNAIDSIGIDLDGDGAYEDFQSNLNSVLMTVSNIGINNINIELTDKTGASYLAQASLTGYEKTTVQAELQSKLNSMIAYYQAGDINSAVEFFEPSSRENYRAVFDVFKANNADLSSLFNAISLSSFNGVTAEVYIQNAQGSEVTLHTVTFYLDENGQWKILSM